MITRESMSKLMEDSTSKEHLKKKKKKKERKGALESYTNKESKSER